MNVDGRKSVEGINESISKEGERRKTIDGRVQL
jgi:hypothetical protein